VATFAVLCFGGGTIAALVAPAPAAKTAGAGRTAPARPATPAVETWSVAPAPSAPTSAAPSTAVRPLTAARPSPSPTPDPPRVVATAGPAAPTTTAPATRTTTKTVSLCGAPPNPYGYTFCGGSTIYSPAGDICDYIDCIASFWDGRGYVMQCVDGMFSKSGGIQGSCSHHGGNSRALYRK
jgi:hypothetical protein